MIENNLTVNFINTYKLVSLYLELSNMITIKQREIFFIFAKNIFKKYTFKELKAFTNENSNSVIQDSIKKFKENNLINEESIANLKLYSLNTSNEQCFNILQEKLHENLDHLALKSINLLKKNIEDVEFFYSIIIFGSYAQNKQKKNSDLDILLLVKDYSNKKELEIVIKNTTLKSLINLDIHIIDINDFLKMLKEPEENLGKEIARKNYPVHNIGLFYKLLQKGIDNGFKL